MEFLDGCPGTIDAQFTAVLDAVAAAPHPRFSGGRKWEAMHGTMGGWYEIRLTGPGREQLRLFACSRTAPATNWPGAGFPADVVAYIVTRDRRVAVNEVLVGAAEQTR